DGQLVLGQPGVGVDLGKQLGGNRLHNDTQLALHGDVGLQAGAVALVHDQHHAGVREDRRAADEVVEVLEDAEALPSHGRGQAVGVVLADDGARFAAGAGAEVGLLQEEHPPGAALGQVIGDAGADDAAADDQEITRNHGATSSSGAGDGAIIANGGTKSEIRSTKSETNPN